MDPTGPGIGDPRSSPRVLLGGCAFLIVLLAAIVWLSVALLGELSAPGEPGPPPRAKTPAPDAADPPTRTERRALEAELEQLDRDLGFARDQARMALDGDTRAAWQARVEELEARRDEIRTTLGR